MRVLLPLCLLVILSLPAMAEETLPKPEYDPSVPYPLLPIDLVNSDLATMAAWLDPVVASYGCLRVQYPVNDAWYYTTLEKSLSFGEGMFSVMDTTTVGVKAGGMLPDPKLMTAVKLADIDPASIAVSEVLPFDTLFGPQFVLGKEKAEYAATYAQYVLPAWYAAEKPATKKVWKVTIKAHGGQKLFAQVHFGPSNVEPPNVKTLMDGTAAVGLYFTDQLAADRSAQVLRRMAELGQRKGKVAP